MPCAHWHKKSFSKIKKQESIKDGKVAELVKVCHECTNACAVLSPYHNGFTIFIKCINECGPVYSVIGFLCLFSFEQTNCIYFLTLKNILLCANKCSVLFQSENNF